MPGRLELMMTADHVRLDALLARADADPHAIDEEAFDASGRGLLRHIAMEKVLLPMARRAGRRAARDREAAPRGSWRIAGPSSCLRRMPG